MEKSLNPQKEEYLIAIFKLMREDEKVTNKSISNYLNLAPSSVTEMLKKLKSEKLVSDGKDNRLTKEGLSVTKQILSKHRLWEYFLEKELKISWKEVHPIASDLQSVTSDILFDKLNSYLGYPDYCPHGSIIYTNNEESTQNLLKLCDAIKGKSYILRRIRDDKDLLNYCESINIKIGDKLDFIDFDSFDKTAIVKINGIERRISPKATTDIYLKEI